VNRRTSFACSPASGRTRTSPTITYLAATTPATRRKP
jgi:hypothetical protein